MLGRRIAARQPPPTCLPELRRALLDEWCNIPQDQIDNLILSMPRRWLCLGYNLSDFDIKVVSPKTGSAGRRPGQGRRRATTPNEDRYLVVTARRHRNMNATLPQQHLRSSTGTTVSTQIVRNRLHGVGLYARRPMRDRGSRNNPAFVHESVRFGSGGMLVYGGISIDGRTDLYIIRGRPLTAR
ncbi:transposable element Tcb2 transposase [Trichonephila clavipes]|nr:transposable element Tcb2 transposase [Trichonephila clavipes]